MDKRTSPPAPFFDAGDLFADLKRIGKAHSDAKAMRVEVVKRLKGVVATARAETRARLDADRHGRRAAEGLARFADELIRVLYRFAAGHVYEASNPSASERLAVIATGGYGRGLLAPHSDIDLLFLLPYKQTAWGESVVEYILYVLWDLGLKVGHATRSVDQCVALSRSDMTIRTAILDGRLILGDEALFAELERRFRAEVIAGTGAEFVEAKLAERESRQNKIGASRYVVEPNVKEGKGGLRDLHTLAWLIKYLQWVPEAKGEAALSADEERTFRKCEDFLWTVRCHLHFAAGRAEERLSFEYQPVIAERLGYTRHAGLRSVERFMKHYFLVAREVGGLMNTVCAGLELLQLKKAPALNRLFAPLSWRARRRVRRTSEFRIENGRIAFAEAGAIERDPLNLIRIFAQAELMNVDFHPDAVRLIRHSLNRIDEKVRNDPEANRIFIDMLTDKAGPGNALRRMNEMGVLGKFIPDFRRVVSMMQFNMYHHYTLDEHLIRTVANLSEIEHGGAADELPLSTEIIRTVQNRRALWVAAFLHDIGKGREEDHSIVGARIARALCPRFGLTPAETETVIWLIEHHLLMSMVAQSRDITDPKTIRDFAEVVQSPERLRLLLLLTVADIRAVGPGVWNGWKGQLLRTLFALADAVVSGGVAKIEQRARIEAAKSELVERAKDVDKAVVERFTARHYDDYWLKTEVARRADHLRLLQSAEASGKSLAWEARSDAFTAVTELTVMASNHPRLLSVFAGACAAAGANIMGAHVSTTRDGVALDTFFLKREFDNDADELRRAERIGQTIAKLLKGEVRLSSLLAKRLEPPARVKAFAIEPEVVINNTQSEKLTVLEVAGLDRPGLLYELTSAISDLNLDISSAHITTYGERVVDVFYVTDLTGKKITGEARQKAIHSRLEAVLRGVDAAGRAKAAEADGQRRGRA